MNMKFEAEYQKMDAMKTTNSLSRKRIKFNMETSLEAITERVEEEDSKYIES